MAKKVLLGLTVKARNIHRESFASLETRWAELLKRIPTPNFFLTPWWQRLAWEGDDQGELCLLSVSEDSKLLGMAPMVMRGGKLSFLGDKEVCDYRDFIFAPGKEEAFFNTLLPHLDSLPWESLDLSCTPASSPTLTYLPSWAREGGYPFQVTLCDVSPRVELPATWEEYLASLSKKDRHELRRKLRRLEAAGGVRTPCFQGSQAAEEMEDFFRLFKLSQAKAGFLTPEREAFFRSLASSLGDKGFLKLFFLELNGVRVATALCFDYGEECYLYNSGFDPAYASLSVGLLLKALCLKEAICQGKKRFDFLRGAESYKYHLGGVDLPVYQVLISRP